MRQQKAPTHDPVFQVGMKFMAFLKLYHRYELHGIENLPTSGAGIIAISHSFATYDSLLLASEIYLKTGRYCTGLADRRIFQTPGFSQFFSRIGAVNGTPEIGADLLQKGNLLMLSPGGMREALRPSSEKYRVDWAGRLGFARLAIKTQVPVILAACPKADDLYTLYENPITPLVYQKFKWPLPILRGWGPTLLPRPVKLTHYLSESFLAPKQRKTESAEENIRRFHRKLDLQMNKLMNLKLVP